MRKVSSRLLNAAPRLFAAVARFLEEERAEARAVIERLGERSPLKPAEPACG